VGDAEIAHTIDQVGALAGELAQARA
jgi:hypothetical protein